MGSLIMEANVEFLGEHTSDVVQWVQVIFCLATVGQTGSSRVSRTAGLGRIDISTAVPEPGGTFE